MNLLREPGQENDRLELEFISYNIQELKSMVYIYISYTYQWIGFLADLFYLELGCTIQSSTFWHCCIAPFKNYSQVYLKT